MRAATYVAICWQDLLRSARRVHSLCIMTHGRPYGVLLASKPGRRGPAQCAAHVGKSLSHSSLGASGSWDNRPWWHIKIPRCITTKRTFCRHRARSSPLPLVPSLPPSPQRGASSPPCSPPDHHRPFPPSLKIFLRQKPPLS